jgi:NADH-ubiquinone oxidoreductase chain 2
MLLIINTFILLVHAVTFRREFTILFNLVAIFILLYSFIIGHVSCVTCLDNPRVGIYNGLFHSTVITHSFDLFIYIIAPIILLLTGFYARRIVQPIISYNRFEAVPKKGLFSKGYVKAYRNVVMGIDAPQFTTLAYSLIILFILIGAILLMSSSDLVSMFLAIELQSYGLYILATLYRNSEWSTRAGLTYFLLGGLSSCYILLGSAVLYANCGITSLEGIYVFYKIEVASAFGEPISTIYSFGAKPEILSMGFLIMSVGYLFKVSAAPFHFWSPDVIDALDTVVTTFVANLPKISILVFLLGTVQQGSQDITEFSWTNVFLVSSFLSLVVGTVAGLVQFRIKKLLAYSSISHIGFLLLALVGGSQQSVQAFLFYLSQYSLLQVNFFFIVVNIGHYLQNKGMSSKLLDREHSPFQFISQLKGYFYHNPVLSISFAITLLSLAGIPPLLGFFAKQLVLSAALNQGFYFLTLVAILTSVISAVYYLNVIKVIFFNKPGLPGSPPYKIASYPSSTLTITISVLTLINVLFILYPNVWWSSASILAMIFLKV